MGKAGASKGGKFRVVPCIGECNMAVMTGQQMAVVKELNRLPLNQEAKRWLRLVPYPIDEDQPYLLQLMWWGAEEAHIGLTVRSLQHLREDLLPVIYELMDYPYPYAAWEYLTNGRPGKLHPDDLPILDISTLQHSMIPERARSGPFKRST